jgi:hypothetical protein
MFYIPVWKSDNIINFKDRKLLTKEEVNGLNNGVPFMTYLKGKLEWNDEYDYYLIPSTGSFVVKVKKDS